MLRCWIFRSSVSCSTSRACPCASLEKTRVVNAYFCAREASRFCQQGCVLLTKRIRMDNDHTAHWSMIERFDIVKPHVALLCVPGFEWVILREDCLTHRTPFKSKCGRCVPRVELQVKRQLVCTRTVRPRSTVHPKISSLALLLRFCEEQIRYCCSERHFEFVFPLSKFIPRHRQHELPAKIAIDNLFQWCRRRLRLRHGFQFLTVNPCDLAVTVESAICWRLPYRFLTRCLGTRTSTFVPCGLNMETFVWLWRHAFQIITRLSHQFVTHALGCLDHTLVCFYERHRDSEDSWPVRGRCRESSRVVLPVRRGFHDSGSSQQA